jgi:hypothetical protein
MNELNLAVDDRDAFEEKLRQAGGVMGEPHWIGNWYLKSTPGHVVKIMQTHGVFSLLELRKLDAGYAFVSEKVIDDIEPYRLDKTPPENVLRKTVRPWMVKGLSVDVLAFDEIGVYACVNFENDEKSKALGLIASLNLANAGIVEVPFNVMKRRQLGCRTLCKND